MATFDEFYASLDPDVGIRGKQFEKFVKWFLKTDPTWGSQIDEIWLWNEYPKRWGADCGIDLIFTHKNGNTWAVQSKCVSPSNDIKKSEIDSFLSESNDSKIDGRLLIASTDGIGKNAQQVINRQEKQVVCFLLEQFRQSEIEFPSSMEHLNQGKRKEKKTPRPHQIEAIEKVSEGLKTADRGQVLMACGTGKTLTSLWIKEKIKAEQVLVLVPSLSLLSQTLKEWNTEANETFKWICVCSDKSVAKDKSEDQWISNTSEIGVPVTSETLEIKNFLDESGSKVIFSTYQSAQLIIEAQEHHDTNEFDLVIADEAHRCAGKVSYAFGCVLDENKVKASKRLFFTATPRILSRQIKTKSLSMDYEVASMDDHSIFGDVLYQLQFSEAIKKDLLSDYQVVVIGVDDAMIKQKIVKRELIKVDPETILDSEMIASQIAITKAIKDYDLKRVITFHSRIKNAKEFANNFDPVIQNIDKEDLVDSIFCEHISGIMKTSERNQKLYDLRNLQGNERRILTNSRCLSEGVDVPTLSGIAFIDPKQSQIDIIQAVGRAIRKSIDKKRGTIVIPLYISEEESLEETLILSNFKKVWQIVLALKSQDDSLMECIDKLRIQKGRKGKISFESNELDKFIFDIPEKINAKFSKSIKTLTIENTSQDWFENYGKLVEYFNRNGHSNPYREDKELGTWCQSQRQAFSLSLISKQRIELLNNLNFDWEIVEKQWNENYQKLKEFYIENGYSNAPQGHPLGLWCGSQRSRYRNKKLSQKRISLLEELNFIWDPYETQWNDSYLDLKEFFIENGHSNPETKENEKLKKWCLTQIQRYRKKKLPQDKINLLEELNFIWDPLEKQWQDSYIDLKEFFIENGHSNPSNQQNRRLYGWCINQIKRQEDKKLTKEKIDLLNEINFVWDPPEKPRTWEEIYNELKDIHQQQGNNFSDLSRNLKSWSTSQRKKFRENKLSQEKINLLNEINFVWDLSDTQWQNVYQELKEVYQQNDLKELKIPRHLSSWCTRQREQYKENNLSQKKFDLLEEINFVWDPLEKKWQDTYQELKEIYQKEKYSISKVSEYLRSWSSSQRTLFRENKLSPDKIDQLNDINFVWDPLENRTTWEENYQQLKEVYQKQGDKTSDLTENLKNWSSLQRKNYKGNKLSQEKINLLEEINFAWDAQETQWQNAYQELKEIYEKDTNLSLPSSTFISSWTTRQRNLYRENKLSQEKINLLNEINFVWDPLEKKWQDTYQELKEIYQKEKYSISKVSEYLRSWSSSQRTLFRENKLSPDKIDQLNDINFVWDPLENRKTWEENYQQLKEIYQTQGNRDSDLPKDLKNWSSSQRSQYRQNKLIQEKVDLLNKIEFIWDLEEEAWNDAYKKLKNFYIREGNSYLNKEKSLEYWGIKQRRRYKNKQLPEEKIKLLEEIKFAWDPIQEQWNSQYLELKTFYLSKGHSSPSSWNSSLGVWCAKQRQYYMKNKLSQDKIKLLEEINFVWDPVKQRWDDSYTALKELFIKKGHTSPNDDQQLQNWCRNQRTKFNKKELSEEKIEKLNKIKFKWIQRN